MFDPMHELLNGRQNEESEEKFHGVFFNFDRKNLMRIFCDLCTGLMALDCKGTTCKLMVTNVKNINFPTFLLQLPGFYRWRELLLIDEK